MRAVEAAVGSGHQAPCTASGATQRDSRLHGVSVAFLSCLDDGNELMHCGVPEQAIDPGMTWISLPVFWVALCWV